MGVTGVLGAEPAGTVETGDVTTLEQDVTKVGVVGVAVVDTNADPDGVDYVIPGNDDAIRAVKLIAGCMANAIIEGRQGEDAAEASEEETEKVEETEEETAE